MYHYIFLGFAGSTQLDVSMQGAINCIFLFVIEMAATVTKGKFASGHFLPGEKFARGHVYGFNL